MSDSSELEVLGMITVEKRRKLCQHLNVYPYYYYLS